MQPNRHRAMADALGDQSDAEITEDDEEMGIKVRQKGEEDRIWEAERRERVDRRGSRAEIKSRDGTGRGSGSVTATATGAVNGIGNATHTSPAHSVQMSERWVEGGADGQ